MTVAYFVKRVKVFCSVDPFLLLSLIYQESLRLLQHVVQSLPSKQTLAAAVLDAVCVTSKTGPGTPCAPRSFCFIRRPS